MTKKIRKIIRIEDTFFDIIEDVLLLVAWQESARLFTEFHELELTDFNAELRFFSINEKHLKITSPLEIEELSRIISQIYISRNAIKIAPGYNIRFEVASKILYILESGARSIQDRFESNQGMICILLEHLGINTLERFGELARLIAWYCDMTIENVEREKVSDNMLATFAEAKREEE